MLSALRRDWASMWETPEDRLAAQVLITAVVLLIVYAIWGRPFFISAHLPTVAGWVHWRSTSTTLRCRSSTGASRAS